KSTEGSALFQLFQAFATPEETADFRQAFADGIGWGEAKERLFQRVDREVGPMRTRYEELVANPARIEAALAEGARKARALVSPLMESLRHAVGLRNLAAVPDGSAAAGEGSSGAAPAGRATDAARP